MWPFSLLRKRTYDRRYKAAVVVLLGSKLFDRMDAAQRTRIELETNENFNRSDTPAVAWRKVADQDVIAAFRAAAMERLGIELPIPALSWSQLFGPWAHWRKWPQRPLTRDFDNRPAFLLLDYRPMDAATADAEAYLRSVGIGNSEGAAQEIR